MDRRIARLALARFRVGGFTGTSIADLAGALGISKAAIYYHYRSKDALLHHLVDPLLDAIDTCIQDHNNPPDASAQAARQLLDAYLAVLLAHREVVPLIAIDVAVLNHPKIGPRLRAQNRQLQSLLAAPDPSPSARLRAEAALGAFLCYLLPRCLLIPFGCGRGGTPVRHTVDAQPPPSCRRPAQAEHPAGRG